jgi:hypothetical protein
MLLAKGRAFQKTNIKAGGFKTLKIRTRNSKAKLCETGLDPR